MNFDKYGEDEENDEEVAKESQTQQQREGHVHEGWFLSNIYANNIKPKKQSIPKLQRLLKENSATFESGIASGCGFRSEKGWALPRHGTIGNGDGIQPRDHSRPRPRSDRRRKRTLLWHGTGSWRVICQHIRQQLCGFTTLASAGDPLFLLRRPWPVPARLLLPRGAESPMPAERRTCCRSTC